jgi:hypothetical protein
MRLRISQVSITLYVRFLHLKFGWNVSPLTSHGIEINLAVASYLRNGS